MQQGKGLSERQPNEEMEGKASNLPPLTRIRISFTIIGVGIIYKRCENLRLFMRKDRASALSKPMCNTHPMLTLGWRLNIKMRQNLAPDIGK